MFGLKEELLHPIFLHFPIVFLVVASLAYIALWGPWEENLRSKIEFVFYFNFYAGLFSMWPTIFFGEIAADKLRPQLADVSLLSRHEIWGERALYLYIAAAVALLLLQFESVINKRWVKKLALFLVPLFLWAGLAALIYGADLGAQLTRL